MKNLLKRSMAFMLAVCMLLSVVPAGLFQANAVATEGNVITYDIDAASFLGSSSYKALTVGTDLGDFVYLEKGSQNGHTRAYADDTYGYRININAFQLADGSANK